jgi:hypothetical protein
MVFIGIKRRKKYANLGSVELLSKKCKLIEITEFCKKKIETHKKDTRKTW